MNKQLLLILLTITSSSVFSIEFPEGWRKATAQELESFYNWRDESDSKYTEAHADFNGDGKVDNAYLLKSNKFEGQGLIIKLSTPTGYIWYKADSTNFDKLYPNKNYKNLPLALGIVVLPPESIKSYIENSPFELGSDKLKPEDYLNHAIDYFKMGSAASIIYWSKSENRFKRYWYSD